MGDEKDKELSPQEQIAQLRAEVDQMKEGIKEIAAVIWSYYSALKEQGFTDEEAFALTMAYQQQLMANSGNES